ncbi:unnamed protein product [Paramecium octaurelia]|uniref:Uncharacterized protein n=1 Tax=Paramecium octaurelia TaxID=43137 RepID=A0A8S1Y089_PAROT|nr:unnamed protein product [Paramecium octaurelia]
MQIEKFEKLVSCRNLMKLTQSKNWLQIQLNYLQTHNLKINYLIFIEKSIAYKIQSITGFNQIETKPIQVQTYIIGCGRGSYSGSQARSQIKQTKFIYYYYLSSMIT